MKRTKKLLAVLPFLFMMAGCGEKNAKSNPKTTNTVITSSNKDDKTDVRYQIYLSAVSAGYDGNYEAWLESIKGDSIQLKVENNYVKFKYSQATEWVNLISLDALKGDSGATGKNSKLQVANGYIQWQNEGDETWNNLIALDDLKGVDGNSKKTDMRVDNGYIQWKYEDATTWNDLLDLSTLKGANGKNAIMQVDGDYIQWKVEGTDTWTNIIEVASLKGEKGDTGKQVSLTVADGFIKWQNEGDTDWNELISIDSLKGATGAAGKKSLMRNNGTYIQWQNEGDGDEDEDWNNLIAVADLKGDTGDDGDEVELREENGIIQWKYSSASEWIDLYNIKQDAQIFYVTFDYGGRDVEDTIPFEDLMYYESIGHRGDKVEFGGKIRKPTDPYKQGYIFDGWYLDDEKWSFIGYSVTCDIMLTAKFVEEKETIVFNDIDIFDYDYDNENDAISIKGIDDEFKNTSFNNIFLPNNITEMQNNAFIDMGIVDNIYYNGTIEDWCNITTTSNIMRKCKHFYYLNSEGEYTVNGMKYSSLDILEIPETITTIGSHQFACLQGQNGINRLILPNTITKIDEGAFYDNESIEAVYYKGTLADWCNKVQIIGENGTNPLGSGLRKNINTRLYVLNDSGNFEEVCGDLFIPESVTKIGDYQFQGLNRIKTVYISENVAEIGVNPFAYCKNITEIVVDSDNAKYTSRNGTTECNAIIEIDAEDDKDALITGCKNTDFEHINVSLIEKFAFANVEFENVVIPTGVTEIREGAFTGSTLTAVTLPTTLYSVGEFAFVACEKLRTVTNNSETLYAIGHYAFAYCYELTGFTIPETVDYVGEAVFIGDSKLKDIWILCYTNTVYATINRDTFYDCIGIQTIVLTKEVKVIDENAFYNSLTTGAKIFYTGNQSEWNQITISDNGNNDLGKATVYYYSATNPGSGNYWHYDDIGVPTVWVQE